MFDSTFVESLQESAQPKILTQDGRSYSTAPLHNLPFPEQPPFPGIHIHTLDGLVDYVKGNRDGAVDAAAVQIACFAREVHVLGTPQGERRLRDLLVKASCLVPDFTGAVSYTDIESFRVSLLTRFDESPERASILKFISRVQDEAIKTQEDDGVSQRATVKVGVGTLESVIIPSPVALLPFRTFTEVEQPQSDFVFRMQKSDKGPQAALFAIADDWQARAAVKIRDYLREKLGEGFTILA